MKKSKKLLSLLLCFVLVLSMCALGLAACSDNTPTGPLDKTSISVEVGRTGNVSLKESGVATWKISDESIATVKSLVGGKMCAITGVKVGKTTLTATYGGGKTATVAVTVTERNVLTVKANGEAITSADLEKDKTLQLSVTSNIGSKKFKWSSSDNSIATVSNNGLVKGVFAGKATITVKVDGDDDTYATVLVNVKPKEGTTEYKLLMAAEGGTQAWVEADQDYVGDEIKEDTFFEWHTRGNWGQPITFEKSPQYSEGVVSFKYTSDWNPGLWTGMQIFYKKSDHTVGDTYKLNCKINVKAASLTNADNQQDEPLSKFYVTLNDNKIELKQGVNNVEVYYVYTAPLGQGGTSSFDLQMGWPDPSHTNGWFVQNADIEISDITWTHDTPVQLTAPTFTYTDNKVNVTDTNAAGVQCYRAVFYSGENKVGASTFNNGEDFNTDALGKGIYTAKIQAVGINAHYIDSPESAESVSVNVTTDASYTMTKDGAIEEALSKPGTWSYFHQWYVQVETAKHEAGVTTLKFDNNDGTFDTLQLYYKNPTNVAGKNYKLTVDIELLGDDNGGMVTLCGNEINLEPGKHTYEVGYTETAGGASFAMLVAIYEQNTSGSHEITSGTINVSDYSWTEITSITPLATPQNASVTVSESTATVTFDTIAKGAMKGYEIGFFKTASAEIPTMTAKTRTGTAKVNLDFLATGSYVVKVRAKGDGILYAADSAWSAASASFDYTNPKGDVYKLPSNDVTAATSVPGTWTYYAQNWVTNKGTETHLEPTHSEGKVTASFSNNVGTFDALLFCYDHPEAVMNKTYTVIMTITVDNAVITNDGNKGGADYVGTDHVDTTATDFCVIVSGNNYTLDIGTHEYKFELTKGAGELFVILFSQYDESGKQFHRLISADITINDLDIKAK